MRYLIFIVSILCLSSLVATASWAKGREAIVVIDAGHGGKDPGAVSRTGTLEKRVTLATAKQLLRMISRAYGIRAVMTRGDDRRVSLRKRLEVAERHKADLFLSIHADAAKSKIASGASVYILSNKSASSEAARLLARRENKQVSVGDASLKDTDKELASILIDLSQTAALNHSRALASSIVRSLGKMAKNQNVEGAGFVVLKSPDMASVLIELGYLSNPKDEQNLKRSAYQKSMAKAIFVGIKDYLGRYGTSDLLLSNASVVDYTVKKGDTLSGIALRYKSSIASIKKVSGVRSDQIQVGQKLKIPVKR